MSPVPLFWKSEVLCGKVLGTGSFCEVLSVIQIDLFPTGDSHVNSGRPSDPRRQILAQKLLVGQKQKSRKETADLAIYGKATGPPKEIDDPEVEPAPKLALKQVRNEELPSGQLQTAKEDFQRELEILLEMTKPVAASSGEPLYQHPNIIELYGIGFNDPSGGEAKKSPPDPSIKELPSFLLLGQIRTTLTKRLAKWRDDKGLGIYEALSLNVSNQRNHWVERLLIISRVAHAIQHLHCRRILYRDIKPDNIGFDGLDDPKLFDFGLATKISDDMRYRKNNREGAEDPLEEGFFHLTPETGTLRYMAMEVGKDRPYGWSADVYSLGVLMHEVLSLKVPFGSVTPRQFRQVVWNQGQRLAVDSSWPNSVQELCTNMLHPDPTERPAIDDVVATLDGMLRGSEQELFPKAMISRGRRFSLF